MEAVAYILRALLGLAFLIGLCWIFSTSRRSVDWRLVGGGLVLQVALAFLILKVDFIASLLGGLSTIFVTLLGFTDAGTQFVFGFLGAGPGFWEDINSRIESDGSGAARFGLIFAFKILPTVIFFSALTSVLYYLGILQKVVWGMAWVLQRSMRLSGAESLSAAANIFVGQTEAPLVVKPYLPEMTRSELLCLMTGGMATIAGGVFGAFVWMLGGSDPVAQAEFGRHLLTASLLSAPAAIICAKILVPQEESVAYALDIDREKLGSNLFDAATQGTTQGLMLALNIGAMLITFLAFIAGANFILNFIGEVTGLENWIMSSSDGRFTQLSLEWMSGIIFAPIAWLIGASGGTLLEVGQLLGIKLVANEFVAYQQLGVMIQQGTLTDHRSVLIATYALCGFANFSSIGIQIGGMSVLAPNQRVSLCALSLRALFGGTVACLMTAAVAGMFLA
ncbi:MAG: hypothetical protein LR015_04180 [Verrucomicrobia bacterium]|nr:hypothetical protein [Verrucomicrobiota bacterium]